MTVRHCETLLLVFLLTGCAPQGRIGSSSRNDVELTTGSGNPGAADPEIVLVEPTTTGQPQRFQLRGLSPESIAALVQQNRDAEQWQRMFSAAILSDSLDDPPSLLGDYFVETDSIEFKPRYPLRPGSTYRATFHTTGIAQFEALGGAELRREFIIPNLPVVAETVATAIYPGSDIVPENLLRLYLHFSAPMSRGEAYSHLRLLDEDGRPIESPFLELGEELWNRSQTRFTLLFDPGRIKRGLKPRELFGPALIEGHSYTLVIDRHWPDAVGNPLSADATKSFKVAAPDDIQPSPQRWKITAPPAGSREPLIVNFDKPLDHAMLQRVLWIVDSSETNLPGSIEVTEHERRWQFEPELPWLAGDYSLVIDTTLEDVAGNSIGRPFEVDVLRAASETDEQTTVALQFRIE